MPPHGVDTASVGGSCPVRAECLAYAVEADEEFGIWGLNRAERACRRRVNTDPGVASGTLTSPR